VSSKIHKLKLWHIKEQFRRGLNLAATSVLGHVTVAVASAAPELDSTPINKLSDDMRSFVFDSAVPSVPIVYRMILYMWNQGLQWDLLLMMTTHLGHLLKDIIHAHDIQQLSGGDHIQASYCSVKHFQVPC